MLLTRSQMPQIVPLDQYQLPNSYHFANPIGIQYEERVALAHDAGWYEYDDGTPVTADSIREWDGREAWNGVTRLAVGVRNEQAELIGYGALRCSLTHGELGDLSVHSAYRRRKLGKAIIAERMWLAKAVRVESLYTDIEPNNTLRSFYADHGFRDISPTAMGYGPDPRELEIV